MMKLHDWTRVPPGVFHDFHVCWLAAIRGQLNSGLLPPGYYASAEQVSGPFIPDVLTLREPQTLFPVNGPANGSPGVALLAPQTRSRFEVRLAPPVRKHRLVTIRHVSGHRVVALIEIASPANKDRPESVDTFAYKAASAIAQGVHVLLVDPFPPGPHDPAGLTGAIVAEVRGPADPDDPDPEPVVGVEVPPGEPLAFAAFEAGPEVRVYIEPRAVGADIPTMPLFLAPGLFIDVPLGDSYSRAWVETPGFWRDVIDPPPAG